jgi:acyl carrier protein
MKSEIEAKVRTILSSVSELNDWGELIKEGKPFTELGLNSITFIKLIAKIEEEFGFEFPDEDLSIEKFKDFSSLVEYIEEKIE